MDTSIAVSSIKTYELLSLFPLLHLKGKTSDHSARETVVGVTNKAAMEPRLNIGCFLVPRYLEE